MASLATTLGMRFKNRVPQGGAWCPAIHGALYRELSKQRIGTSRCVSLGCRGAQSLISILTEISSYVPFTNKRYINLRWPFSAHTPVFSYYVEKSAEATQLLHESEGSIHSHRFFTHSMSLMMSHKVILGPISWPLQPHTVTCSLSLVSC